MELFLSIAAGGAGGAVLVWLLRGWIEERLKQSIAHEYAQKLEIHKAELSERLNSIKHDLQLRQLRTSLFFEHQREAFAETLAAVETLKMDWIAEGFDPEEGMAEAVPYDSYKALSATFAKHQLFLDAGCVTATNLLIACISKSFPFKDGEGTLHPQDASAPFDRLEYLQPRLAAIFRQRIGVESSHEAEWEVATLGSMLLLSAYHFETCGFPVRGALEITSDDRSAEIVARGAANLAELKQQLAGFRKCVSEVGHGFFQAALSEAAEYLSILAVRSGAPSD